MTERECRQNFHCEYLLGGSWATGSGFYYQNSMFSFTPSQSQVTNNICMVAKVSCPGAAGCLCSTGFVDVGKNPLAAVFDRPWP